MAPFTYESRQEIGKRDCWTCQTCEKDFRSGYMVEASHLDHERATDYYNEVHNGIIECRECHLKRHIEIMLERDDAWSIKAVRLQANNCYKKGLRTYDYYAEHPEELEGDRYRVVEILNYYGLNPDDFIQCINK